LTSKISENFGILFWIGQKQAVVKAGSLGQSHFDLISRSIDIQPETILGVRVERAIGTVAVLAGTSELDAPMSFGIIQYRIEIC
jgi:hypothetical protein